MSNVDNAATAANVITAGAEVSDDGQCVVFRLSEEEFGIKINNVKEIVRLPEITPIPRSPKHVSGICNLRGNVLPVIDTRTRFAMEIMEPTDQTRLLVVENGDRQTSLVVDSVREVMRIRQSLVEPPPEACKGIDRQYLNGVAKVDDGKRLIMMLDLNQVLDIELKAAGAKTTVRTTQTDGTESAEKVSEEEQLVTFRVGVDEYAFDIAKVSEILKVANITEVPNVSAHVLGMFTIRNNLMPILDMRSLLGMPSLVSERHATLESGLSEDRRFVETLENTLGANLRFGGQLNAKETRFGQWLEKYNTASVEVETIVKDLRWKRINLYDGGRRALETAETDKDAAQVLFKDTVLPMFKVIEGVVSELKAAMAEHISEDQRAMVVESGSMSIGFLVDWVDEVIRVPRSVIDDAPAMAGSDKKELRAVAKLENGNRLIMIMDETSLVSAETSRVLTDMTEQAGGESRSTGKQAYKQGDQSIDEEQLVTFSIGKEEYGIRIMQVQEINRITDITRVPRAPVFVDGMTNLRGNVIPVINIRKLFALEDRAVDDRTRIIIVDIGGSKIGLRVDQVNEVLRLSRKDIEATPAIVSDDASDQIMEGICKIDKGKRMVALLNLEKILDRKKIQTIKQMVREQGVETEAPALEKEPVINPEPVA